MANKTESGGTTTKEEGARAFAVLLQQLDEGQLHEDLSDDLHTLLAQISKLAESHDKVKGQITLTLNIVAQRNGTVRVTGDIKTKSPKAPRAENVLWLTKGSNLTYENPRQQKLPGLREVPRASDGPVDAGGERPLKNV